MAQMIMAAFSDRNNADAAVTELESLGYSTKDISIISKENKKEETQHVADNTASGAVSGATTGGAIGGLAGLLAGAGVVPALAGLLIGGPIAAALGATGIAAATISGVVTGAVAGGFIGALTHLGVPEENARYYDTTINEGGVVVAVPMRDEEGSEARSVLQSHNAQQITSVKMHEETSHSSL